MQKRQLIKDWYDGYLFGNTEVYNPWSSINAVTDWVKDIDTLPRPFWVNTSGNDIVRKLIEKADSVAKIDIEALLVGKIISKPIHEDITYDEIEKKMDNLWNFLFFTGYLKQVGDSRQNENGEIILDLTIPNIELRYVYVRKIKEWFDEQIKEKDLTGFFNAILNGDTETFEDELSGLLAESISFMDSAENFYHGFMTGIFSKLKGYAVVSNLESGYGRSDLVLHNRLNKAIIFEFKTTKEFQHLPNACEAALKQIEDNNYAASWIKDGFTDITKYGISFNKKRCLIKKG
jgi:hypothetical protein